MSATMLVSLGGLALCAVGSPVGRLGTNEACRIKTTTGEEIDFNALASKGTTEGGDYIVFSEQFDRYEYIFNICDKLNFNDDICVDGAGACDRSITSEQAVAVWGSAANLTITEQSYHDDGSDKVWTMEMDSREACYYRPQKVTVFKVFFVCSPDAVEPVLSIKYEDYLECEVDINFETALACGNGPTKYACSTNGPDGYKCTPSADGTQTFEECDSKCIDPNPPAPPPPRFACDPSVAPGVCSEAPAGAYPTEGACNDGCKYVSPKYACVDDRCTKDPDGPFDTEAQCDEACKPPAPPPPAGDKKYRCDTNNKCVETETGADLKVCEEFCEAAPTAVTAVTTAGRHSNSFNRHAGARAGYRCAEGKVVRNMFGGADLATVSALCGTAAPPAAFHNDISLALKNRANRTVQTRSGSK